MKAANCFSTSVVYSYTDTFYESDMIPCSTIRSHDTSESYLSGVSDPALTPHEKASKVLLSTYTCLDLLAINFATYFGTTAFASKIIDRQGAVLCANSSFKN